MCDDMLDFTMYMPRSWFSNLRSFTLRRCISYQRLLEMLNTISLLEESAGEASFTVQKTIAGTLVLYLSLYWTFPS